MAIKRKTVDSDTPNNNVNTNKNINNNTIIIDGHSLKPSEKRLNWLAKALIGGIITVIVSLTIYYVKKTMDKEADSTIPHEINSVQPNN